MANYKKGIAARQNLVSSARLLFNKKGINITLIELAEAMEVSIGNITNHYRTKDHLFVAISKEYQQHFEQLYTRFVWDKKITLKQLANYFSTIMDLQYEYRCAIISAASTSNSQKELYGQINETYKQNKANAKKMIALYVQGGLLEKNVLEKKRYEVFSFLTISLMTTWVISHEMYDNEKGYKKMKLIYLKGILSCFEPYFTATASKEWGNLNLRGM